MTGLNIAAVSCGLGQHTRDLDEDEATKAFKVRIVMLLAAMIY